MGCTQKQPNYKARNTFPRDSHVCARLLTFTIRRQDPTPKSEESTQDHPHMWHWLQVHGVSQNYSHIWKFTARTHRNVFYSWLYLLEGNLQIRSTQRKRHTERTLGGFSCKLALSSGTPYTPRITVGQAQCIGCSQSSSKLWCSGALWRLP